MKLSSTYCGEFVYNANSNSGYKTKAEQTKQQNLFT
jgi:hypothetical protein